jgi:hypothetical protein
MVCHSSVVIATMAMYTYSLEDKSEGRVSSRSVLNATFPSCFPARSDDALWFALTLGTHHSLL